MKLLSFFLGPNACLPDLLHLFLAHEVLHLDLVLPVADIEAILKVLGNVLKVLIACC